MNTFESVPEGLAAECCSIRTCRPVASKAMHDNVISHSDIVYTMAMAWSSVASNLKKTLRRQASGTLSKVFIPFSESRVMRYDVFLRWWSHACTGLDSALRFASESVSARNLPSLSRWYYGIIGGLVNLCFIFARIPSRARSGESGDVAQMAEHIGRGGEF